MAILEGRGIVKEYKQGENSVFALNGVDVSFEEGSFVAITGESGSGKSTLLNILSGMDVSTEGTVYFQGEEIPKNDKELSKFRANKIGMIFQSFHLLPMLTAEENLLLPGRFAGNEIPAEEIRKLMKELGLEGREKHLPSELSGGQQQRVAIGRGLVNNPRILFADEPTGNLDKKNSEEIMELLMRLQEQRKMTLIVVTHSEKIAELADRRIYMEDGKILRDEVRK